MNSPLPIPEGAPVRVVLADHKVLVRELLGQFLTREPRYRIVAEAGDVRQAVAACREHRPEVLILDPGSPELNGVEAVPLVRRASPGTRILCCSASADEALIANALRAGPEGYLEMTRSGAEFRRAVGTVAGGERYFCPRAERIRRALQGERRGVNGAKPPALSPREREVLRLIASGLSNKEAADRLRLGVGTVRAHRNNLLHKLRSHNAADLTRHAVRLGLAAGR